MPAGRTRITRLGIVLIGVLIASLVALFVGSKTVQAIGFVVALLVVLLLVGGSLPKMRVLGGAPYTPSKLMPQDRPSITEPERAEQAGVPSKDVWAVEEARYREARRRPRE